MTFLDGLIYAQIRRVLTITFILLLAGYVAVPAANDKNAALIEASRAGRLEEVKRLLGEGADVNARDKDGWTALMHAVREGQPEVVDFLLDHGAQVHVQDETSSRLLMRILRLGDLHGAKLLLHNVVDKKRSAIDLFDLMSLFTIPASASHNALPWNTGNQPGFPVEWKTGGPEPHSDEEGIVKRGEAVVTLNGEPLNKYSEGEPALSSWQIRMMGHFGGAHEVSFWCETTGGCMDLESELRKRNISFELYKCEREPWESGKEKIYAIKASDKKPVWLHYTVSSGTGGCWGGFTLFLDQGDADQVPDLVTDCSQR
jgi:hypothetical protein